MLVEVNVAALRLLACSYWLDTREQEVVSDHVCLLVDSQLGFNNDVRDETRTGSQNASVEELQVRPSGSQQLIAA